MQKKFKTFSGKSVYIAKSGTPDNYFNKNAYCFDAALLEAVTRDIKGTCSAAARVVWQVLANNAEGFEYVFSSNYFFETLGVFRI